MGSLAEVWATFAALALHAASMQHDPVEAAQKAAAFADAALAEFERRFMQAGDRWVVRTGPAAEVGGAPV